MEIITIVGLILSFISLIFIVANFFGLDKQSFSVKKTISIPRYNLGNGLIFKEKDDEIFIRILKIHHHNKDIFSINMHQKYSMCGSYSGASKEYSEEIYEKARERLHELGWYFEQTIKSHDCFDVDEVYIQYKLKDYI